MHPFLRSSMPLVYPQLEIHVLFTAFEFFVYLRKLQRYIHIFAIARVNHRNKFLRIIINEQMQFSSY